MRLIEGEWFGNETTPTSDLVLVLLFLGSEFPLLLGKSVDLMLNLPATSVLLCNLWRQGFRFFQLAKLIAKTLQQG